MPGEGHACGVGCLGNRRQPGENSACSVVQAACDGRDSEQQFFHHCSERDKGIVGLVGEHEDGGGPEGSFSFDEGTGERRLADAGRTAHKHQCTFPRPAHQRIDARQLVLATDEGRCGGDEAFERCGVHGVGRRLREHSELDRQRGAQPPVYLDRAVTPPVVERSAHDLTSRWLVEGVELEHAVPLTADAQQIDVPGGEQPPRLVRPGVVAGGREQFTGVEKRGGTCRNRVPGGKRTVGSRKELIDVGAHSDTRKQLHVQLLQDDCLWVRESLAGMVSRLAQVRSARRRVELRPQRVDHLIACELSTGREREQLHQLTGTTGRESRHYDSRINRQLERAEEADMHLRGSHLHLSLPRLTQRSDTPL